MIDIHCHILPQVDDGSPSLEESLQMAAMAVDSGVDTMICTPHANQMGRFENFNGRELWDYFYWFRDQVHQAGIPLDLYLGMEIYSTPDMADKIKRKQLISLNHTGYYLVEFDFESTSREIEYYLQSVAAAGGIPVMAHPERYTCIQRNPSLIYHWCRRGCLAQLNRGSLLGRFGRPAQDLAFEMMDHNLVTCIATDAHSSRFRTTHMTDIREYVADIYGEEKAVELLQTNPERIITGRRIPFRGREF